MTAGATLGARAWADLFLLGLLAGTPRPAADLLAAIGRMPWVGPADRHLLSERLAALLDQDQIVTDGRSRALRPTPAGRAQIIRLLRLDLDPAATLLRDACGAMPGCLLELVGEEVRNDIVRSVCWCRERFSAAASSTPCECCPLLARCIAIEQQCRMNARPLPEDRLLEEGWYGFA